ncbi:hypothetical protein ABIA33_007693 [Streptacidiphilus sp. MAP12-16]|uniref:DUF4145 domain-containing protein n=1 Tax=Streptacidiphilus sp. MAP12-16 TaxID=3156300 RepID=UPI003519A8C6
MVNPAILVAAARQAPTSHDEQLPDTDQPWGTCPRCDRQSNFSNLGSTAVTFDYSKLMTNRAGQPTPTETERVTVLVCQGCRQGIAVVEEKERESSRVRWRGMHWWPSPGMQPGNPDVPAAIADAVAEGSRCLATQAPRAAAVMFRSALALIVDDRGSAAAKAKRNLFDQLKQMADDKDLDAALGEFADHIRTVGNAGAHPSTLDPVSMEEATELAEFIGHMIRFLYILPAKVHRSRAKRP